MSRRSSRAIAWLGAATAAIALGLATIVLSRAEAPGPRSPAHTSRSLDSDAGERVLPPSASDAIPPRPASLRGTDVPGGFVVDEQGHLRTTPDILELFEYFFSATGEEPDEQIRRRIEAEIHARLSPPAREEALALLDAYLDYREQARELFEAGGGDLPLEIRFQRIRELRRAVFGSGDAEILFGQEEDLIRIELERRRVAMDPALSPEERTSRLEALDAELPAEVVEARAAARAALDLRRDEARLRAEGAGDAEIQALRERRFGPEASARLAALDRERAAWQRRVTEWQDLRQRLERALADDPAALAEALESARTERFSEAESVRLRALERIESEAARR
jgi:lipase chaperone LimK